MAILNSIEGQAHVESQKDLANWGGYIILIPDLANLDFFDIAGPTSKGIYEGPVMMDGIFYFANGSVSVRKVKLSSSELRVEFIGNGKLNLIRLLSRIPDDYLS